MAVSSLLGVFAHPDDESLSAGGLLAQNSGAGARTAVVTTTWAAGTHRVAELAEALRILGAEEPRLLGYADFAHFKLEPEMAGAPEAVRDLLMAVWPPARARAEADGERLAELMRADGINDDVAPWDWRYYAAIRQAKEHDFDEAALRDAVDAFGRRQRRYGGL